MVVVTIIAILASILLPALNTAKQAAWKIRCVGELRTIYNTCSSYAEDNNDWLPPSYDPGGGNPYASHPWFSYLMPAYISSSTAKMSYNGTLWTDMPPAKDRHCDSPHIAYGMTVPSIIGLNEKGKGIAASHVRRFTISSPSLNIYIGDSPTVLDCLPLPSYAGYGGWGIGRNRLHYRHPGYTANVAWIDGHVSSLSYWDRNDTDNRIDPDNAGDTYNKYLYWGMWRKGFFFPLQ